jgi:hypothetical protein
MKNITIYTFSFLLCFSLSAQTKVTKKTASKNNSYGITYSLPRTTLIINTEVIRKTSKAGIYSRYAEKYLGVKTPVMEDRIQYRIGSMNIVNKGIPDRENTYIVEFKAGTTAPYAFLTEEGLICTVNADYTPDPSISPDTRPDPSKKTPAIPEKASAYTEELLMAGSEARQAEVAARQIYRIRESRMNILTGEAENLPPDGEAMKLVIQQLDQQEKTLVGLFTGTTVEETEWYDVMITPDESLDREVLFRFSEQLGIVDADDLSGAPVYINIKSLDPQPAPSDTPSKSEKAPKGLAYNIPGKASAEIYMNRKLLLKEDILVTQFGRQEYLAPSIFEDRKTPVKIYFYPETGAIKQIIQ